jgi:ribosomal protein L16/L10AE
MADYTEDDRGGQGMKQLEKLLADIKARTIVYEALDDDAEEAADQACDAWDELAEAYAAEDKELNRIDIEGE